MRGITLESMALVAAGGAAVLLAYTCLHRQAAATPTTTLNLPTANLPQATPTLANSSFALITGVAPGTMGEGIAEALAALGCRIAAVEHPSRLGSCEESCARLRKVYGVEAVAFAADCTAQAEVDAVFEAAAAALGGEPNIVVSTIGGGGVGTDGTPRNGGHHPDGTPRTQLFHEESWETSMRILSTTQFSQHHCCRAAARHMIKGERGGSLLLIGSIMADFSHPTSATYSSSKCAVRKLGEVLARELAPRSIRVNVLQPGHIRTAAELASGMSDSSEGKRAQEARIPLRRMGTPADVGAAAAFLCSMQAAYITGSTLSVDGGWTVGMDLRSEGSPM